MPGNGLLLQDAVAGIVFLTGDKENPTFGPAPKELIINVSLVYRHNRAGRKGHRLGNLHLMNLAVGDMSEYRQITI